MVLVDIAVFYDVFHAVDGDHNRENHNHDGHPEDWGQNSQAERSNQAIHLITCRQSHIGSASKRGDDGDEAELVPDFDHCINK